jgi:hypothetical protein
MIQPTTSIHHVIFLYDAYPTSIRWSVRKDKDSPSLIGRFANQQFLKPTNLFVVDNDFVGGVARLAKDGAAQSD